MRRLHRQGRPQGETRLIPSRCAILLLGAALAAGCSRPRQGDFRTTSTPSADRQTLLLVDTTERPGCTPEVDHQAWPQPAASVTPGAHTVRCAGDRGEARVVVHEGATVRIDLLGP